MTATTRRHGCLTSWLAFMVVVNSLTALVYLSSILLGRRTATPRWALIALAFACIANVLFAIAIFRWKRWGFHGFIVTSIFALAINLRIGIKPVFAIVGLLGILVLYTVLQIGGERKGWNQLE